MKKKKTIPIIIMTIALIGFIICAVIIASYYISLKKQNDTYEELASQVNESLNNQEVSDSTDDSATQTSETPKYVSPIDFEVLKADTNPDIYAWIKIPGTSVDYPVLQHPDDDSFYLTHNIDGSKGYPGCIYSEHYNNTDFNDRITVLYGHYMKDGSMFTSLHNFMDKDFFDNNTSITIYLPDEEKSYTVYRAFYADDKRLTVWYDSRIDSDMEDFIQWLDLFDEDDINHKREMDVTVDDHFLVLETCVDNDKTGRYAVVAVENKDEK